MVRRNLGGARQRARHLVNHGPIYWRESAALPIERGGRARRLLDIASGYHPLEADWYRQIHGDRRHWRGFITNFDREERLRGINGSDGYVVDNKLVLSQILAASGLPTPRLFGVRTIGPWLWTEGGRAALDLALAAGDGFVIKPIRGKKGGGFRLCTEASALEQSTPNAVIATERVSPAAYARAIFPSALNTIRLLMLRDATGNLTVASAMHRFGSARSAPVDNFSAGGVVARVDLASGRLERAVSIDGRNRVSFIDRHPETDAPITGVAIPDWDQAMTLVAHLGEALPLLRYIGWDIAISEHGPTVIEGNSHPSLRFFQFYGSLVDDAASCAFFSRYIPRLGETRRRGSPLPARGAAAPPPTASAR